MTPLDQSYRLISLTQGYSAIVDVDLYSQLIQWKWMAVVSRKRVYAARTIKLTRGRKGKKFRLFMHQAVLGISLTGEDKIDHKEPAQTLDNRRSNLRFATSAQSSQNRCKRIDNTSGYKGVHFHKPDQKWVARIAAKGTRYCLGYFETKEEAYEVYRAAALRLHGEFAQLY